MQRFVFVLSTLEGGGAELSTILLANEMSKSRTVEIISGRRVSESVRCLINKSVKVNIMKAEGFSGNLLELVRILNSHNEMHCVISICSHVSILMYFAHAMTRNKKKRKLVFSERAVFEVNTPRTAKGMLISMLSRWVYRKADRIHAISTQVAKSVTRVCPNSSSIFVVANICERAQKCTKLAHERSHLKVASINRLSRDKHIEEQLLAVFFIVQNNPQARSLLSLDIYGEGEEEERLKDLNRKLDLEDLVSFKGYVNNSLIDWENIDLIVSTSSHEGFGRTVFEALVNDKSLVAYNYEGIPKGIDQTHIIPFGNTHLLAKQIANVLSKRLLGQYVASNRSSLRLLYSARSITAQFLGYCDEIDSPRL